MAERLSMLPGVAQVQVYGSQQYAVRVQVDPVKMAANNIGLDQVSNIISSANVNLPTGALYGKDIYSSIRAPGQLQNAQEYNELILFMSGILGKLLHEPAVVIITAILLSGIISTTVTPMLCNVFLRDRHCEERT
ncbi:acrB/AcrD/AcrF family protein [Rickettsia amblyommatis str. Darkwater]|nr:efflux RND transporter permease subunit [Rickettsia amblyommatis]KJV94971.1 acrB/AcrD/AcrF family protein [Rickettsia amblyommatis str. Darkwater]